MTSLWEDNMMRRKTKSSAFRMNAIALMGFILHWFKGDRANNELKHKMVHCFKRQWEKSIHHSLIYRTSQITVWFISSSSQLVVAWQHQRGLFLIFSFFPALRFENFHRLVTHQHQLQHLYQASKLFLLHWLRGKWSDLHDVLFYGFQRRYQATYRRAHLLPKSSF